MNEEKKLTPFEFEQKLLERETQESDPLDVHSAMLKFYLPRFQGQINHLSKKEFQNLMVNLAGSEFNDRKDVNKVIVLSNGLNVKAINRVVFSVIKSPFLEEDFSLLSEKEEKLFRLFDDLLTNKYYSCLKDYLNKPADQRNEDEIFIAHLVDTNAKEFQRRSAAEKDAFNTGDQLLISKYLMIFSKIPVE